MPRANVKCEPWRSADADPLQVICLNSGFKNNDQFKANAVQTFKARNKGAETATVVQTV